MKNKDSKFVLVAITFIAMANLPCLGAGGPADVPMSTKMKVPAGATDVHVIAIYEGQYPAGVQHSADFHPTGTAKVSVKLKGRPVTLWLSSYEPVIWTLTVDPGVVLKKVIATGYYRQVVNGLPAGVPLHASTIHEDAEVFTYIRNRDEVLDTIEAVKAVTGKNPSSIQSEYGGNAFVLDARSTVPSTALKTPQKGYIGPVTFVRNEIEPLAGILSADRLTVGYCCAGAFTAVRATRGYAVGKVYFEMQLRLRQGGFEPLEWTEAGLLSAHEHSGFAMPSGGEYGYSYGVIGGDRSRYVHGDVLGIAADFDNARMYYHLNGQWITGAPGGGGGIELKRGREYFAGVTVSAAQKPEVTDRWTANFGASPFRYAVPRGYTAYDGKGSR